MKEMNEAGYDIVEDVLSGRECDALDMAVVRSGNVLGRAGARHLMATPEFSKLASDQRLLNLAAIALGARAVPFRITLFDKSMRSNWLVVWHQDTALPLESHVTSDEWGPWSRKAGILYAHAPAWALSRVVALRVHLDAATHDNGPLRVIPGSHRRGVLADPEVFEIGRREKAVECVVPRGGVMAMRPMLIHSSSKARSDLRRRVLHIEYAESLALDHQIRLAVA